MRDGKGKRMNYKEKILEHAIANVLTDAMSYPKNLGHHILGENLSGLIDTTKQAVVDTGLYIIDNDYMLAHEQVSRVEVIEDIGRAYVKYGVGDVITAIQDDGRTLKLFLRTN
jgi:hypothetical protein